MTEHPTAAGALRSFAEFVAAEYTPHAAHDGVVCDGCGSPHVAGAATSGHLYCMPCQKGAWGAEQAEHDVIYETIRGALEGALRLTSPEIVHAAAVAALLDAIAGED